MSEEVKASLVVELDVECPHCDDFFDLMVHHDDARGFLNEEGSIFSQAIGSGDWTEMHRDFKEDVICPSCKKLVHVVGIAW